jgi:hypothetical protein
MRATAFLTLSLLAFSTTACVQVRALRPEMTIQVKPTGTDSYTVQGNTNLPGKTNILVQAVRSLQPQVKPADSAAKPQPVYAIVAREQVTTSEDGKWQTTLKVLQPQAQGAPLESWQQNFLPQQLPLQADPNLNFIATTDPLPGNLEFEGDVADGQKATTPNPALQVNINGSRFLKAQQSLAVQPPAIPNKPTVELSRKVVPVTAKPIAPEANTAKTGSNDAKKTTAPLQPAELVR